MASTCPYDQLAPANLAVCEADRCGWITQPANTWSNVGFVIVAVVIAVAARRAGARRARLLAPIALATGLTSAAFHATSTLLGQSLDQGVMLLQSSLFIVLDLAWLRPRWPARAQRRLYGALAAGSIAVLIAVPTSGIGLFVGHVAGFLGLELVIVRRRRRRTYRWLAAVGVAFALAWGLWWLDITGVVCDPDNHVFGAHAAWHLLGALQLYFWYRHYADADLAAPRSARSPSDDHRE